ncbi:MAG: hypothetical protein KY450_00540 [Actinobacteria bacterium]|nr:hypothetical protein [Actinomycetota bacterium]
MTISVRRGSSTIDMRSCATCHRRTWVRDGEDLDLEAVLGAMASDPPATRRPRRR